MIGTAIGDALGAPFEGKDNPQIREIADSAKERYILTYTDDTHMMIGGAESIIRSRGFNAEDMLKRFIDNYDAEPVYIAKLDIIDKYIDEMDKDSIELELGNGVEAYNSVPTAIYSFLSFPDSFESAVLNAISLGGDTDTIGAMTGALSGAYLGFEAIPEKWVRKLENRDYIETLSEQLLVTKTEVSRKEN